MKQPSDKSGSKEVSEEKEVSEVSSFKKKTSKTSKTHITSSLPLLSDDDFQDFIKSKSKTRQILYFFFRYGNMTHEELGKFIDKDRNQTSTLCSKKSVSSFIEKKNDERPAKWGLSIAALAEIREEVERWSVSRRHAAEKLAELEAARAELEKEKDELVRAIKEWGFWLELTESDHLARWGRGEFVIVVDFLSVQNQSPWLAERLLERPEDSSKALEVAVEKKDWPSMNELSEKKPDIILHNVPEDLQVSVPDLRSKDYGRLQWSNVEIEIVSDVRSEAHSARFECPSCGNIIVVVMNGQKFDSPSRCGCGRKGRFRLLGREMRDTAVLYVTEPLGEMLGRASQRTRVRAELRGLALTKKDVMRRLGPGVQLRLTYEPKDEPIFLKTGGQSKRFDLTLLVRGLDIYDKLTFNLSFTEEEIESFEEAAAQPDFLERFIRSAFPAHYGDECVKRALTAQLVAGAFTETLDQERVHILLSGDPGVGKTKNLLYRQVALSPIAHLTSATTASTPGLLGSAGMKDPYTNRQLFEPGVLPRNNKGIVCIDEINALPYEDLKALNEALAHGIVTIDKANIHTKAPAEVCVTAAANPKEGRFDDYDKITAGTLGIEPSLLDRFDCVFVLRDRPDRERDGKIVDRMNGLDRSDDIFTDDWIRRYILYVRDRIRPKLTEEISRTLKDYYVALREVGQQSNTIPTSPRQYTAMRALTLCFAKARLRSETSMDDVRLACEIMETMYRAVGFDMTNLRRTTPAPPGGKTGVKTETIARETPEAIVLAILRKRKKIMPVSELVELAKEHNLTESQVRTSLAKLKAEGGVYEPRADHVGVLE